MKKNNKPWDRKEYKEFWDQVRFLVFGMLIGMCCEYAYRKSGSNVVYPIGIASIYMALVTTELYFKIKKYMPKKSLSYVIHNSRVYFVIGSKEKSDDNWQTLRQVCSGDSAFYVNSEDAAKQIIERFSEGCIYGNDIIIPMKGYDLRLFMPLSYEEWYDRFGDQINIELAESGADRELCFDSEHEFERRYERYMGRFCMNIHDDDGSPVLDIKSCRWLKRQGFNISTEKYYVNGVLIDSPMAIMDDYIAAPTPKQAKDWIETHTPWHLGISLVSASSENLVLWQYKVKNLNKVIADDSRYYSSYETAISYGIKKLISLASK